MNPDDARRPELVLGDVLAAAADDLSIMLGSRDVRRLAPHMLELLALDGYPDPTDGRRDR